MASRFLVPFASGRGLMGGDPLLDLHREMNRLFDDVFRGSSGQGGSSSLASMPRLDMHESDNELCVTADLPGVTPADVDLQIDRDVLTISGERKGENEQKQQNYHLMERSYGRFQRQVQLHRFLGEIRDVQVFVQAAVDDARDPQFDALLGGFLRCGEPGFGMAVAWRGDDVIAKPSVLADVRQRHGQGRLTVEAPLVARQQARFVDEESLLGAGIQGSVASGRQHAVTATQVPRMLADA